MWEEKAKRDCEAGISDTLEIVSADWLFLSFEPFATPHYPYLSKWSYLHESCSILSILSVNSNLQTNSWPEKISHRGFWDVRRVQGRLQIWEKEVAEMFLANWDGGEKISKVHFCLPYPLLSSLCPLSCFHWCCWSLQPCSVSITSIKSVKSVCVRLFLSFTSNRTAACFLH